MRTQFLDSLYNEEESLYNDLVDIQRLILKRGGKPKYLIGVTTELSYKNIDKSESNITLSTDVFDDNYQKDWFWDRKAKYAFIKLGGSATPKQVIDFLIDTEGVHTSKSEEGQKIIGNVYNAISKMHKAGKVQKDKIDLNKYVLITEEALL